ncbi:unnamed protein product [Gongylonema pulchrum]|uniref:Uncharacterized protein n=1 Tax=Gongylonema pulchrum TaxID=637853 RepID=A0A183EA45_9BILA|nr:unnamed protein product [Gongylonema pulchrum]
MDDVKPDGKSGVVILEIEPNGGTALVHPKARTSALKQQCNALPTTGKETKVQRSRNSSVQNDGSSPVAAKQSRQRSRSSTENDGDEQAAVSRIEAEAFLRDTRRETSPAEVQRPQVASDLEPRTIVVGTEPRTCFSDPEGLPSSNDEFSSMEAAETDTPLQNFLMRVSVNEDLPRSNLSVGSNSQSYRFPAQHATTFVLQQPFVEQDSEQQRRQPSVQKPSDPTPKSRHKSHHTFV